MSALCSFSEIQSVFKTPERYCYHAGLQDEADIIAFPGVRNAAKPTLEGALKRLGQYCADRKNRGVLFPYEIHEAWAPYGVSRATRHRWRRQLIEAGSLLDVGDGYQLKTYARHNRTPEEWADAKARRAQYKAEWRRQKRAEQRAEKADSVPKVATPVSHPRDMSHAESPDTACTFNILEGGDSHTSTPQPDLSPPVPLRRMSKPTAVSSVITSPQRVSGTGGERHTGLVARELRVTSSDSTQPRYTGRSTEPTALETAVGPDKSGCKRPKTWFDEVAERIMAKQQADRALQSPAGNGR